jgi:hypothetical protein
MMEIKPVGHVEQPGYPTRREVLAGAVSFSLLSLTKCSFVFAASEEGKVTVAPIFKHGDGSGATGCIVMSPPVFLSEEEGMQILREELAKHGIKLKAGGTLEGIRIPSRWIRYERVDKDNEQEEPKESIVESESDPKPMKLGGMDAEKKIAVEFVAKGNFSDLGGPRSGSSAQDYDFTDVANYVATKVKKQGKQQIILGIFYDPLTERPDIVHKKGETQKERKARWDEEEKQGKEESKKQLRKQAQDFVAWLKEQKAI